MVAFGGIMGYRRSIGMLGHGRIRQLRINLYMYTIYDVSTFVSPVAENIQNILFVWKLFG